MSKELEETESLPPNESFKEVSNPTEVTKFIVSEEPAEAVVKPDSVPSEYNTMKVDCSEDKEEPDSDSSYEGQLGELANLSITASDSKKEESKRNTSTGGIKREVAKAEIEVEQSLPGSDKAFPESASNKEDPSLKEIQLSDLLLDADPTKGSIKQDVFQESDGNIPGRDLANYALETLKVQFQTQKESISVLPEELSDTINSLPEDDKTEKGRKKRIAVLEESMEIMCQGPNFDFKVFYCLSTLLYRLEHYTSLCPLCHCEKEDNGTGAHPKCHIIPKCILKEFKNIHCNRIVDNFIYDAMSKKLKGFESLAFPIFCHKCELEASDEEETLRNIYLKISGAKRLQLKMSPGDWSKVKHILVVILFRGMLIGVDFLKEIKENKAFFDIFEELREYCIDSSKELSNFRVFIVGNEQKSKSQNPSGNYYIELQLRCPQVTRMVRTEEGDVFLYSKFDCFHCVLLIKSTTIVLPTQDEAFLAFPKFLQEYNLKGVGEFISQMRSPDQILFQDPLYQYLPEPPSPVKIILTEDQIDQAEGIHKCNSGELRQIARCQSPLATCMKNSQDSRIFELEERIDTLLKEKKKVQSDLDKAKNELKKVKQSSEKKLREEKAKVQELSVKLYQLQEKMSELEKERNALRKEKEESKKEAERMKLNPLSLTMDKPIDDQNEL